MAHKVMAFIDGENLTLRYEAMLKDGAKPRPGVIHIPGAFVWHPDMSQICLSDFFRISYYQTVVGDQTKLEELTEHIRSVRYDYSFGSVDDTEWQGTIVPRLFKKEKQSSKNKSVDISLTVDMLRHAAQHHLDVMFLFSGDGDYLPLVQEISRSGKQVWLAALSSGLNKHLKYAVDEFFDLDEVLFEQSA